MKTDRTKILSLGEIVKIAGRARSAGKKIVTSNGIFDILHSGHVSNLKWAKSHGDILIVGVNSDRSVRENKGPFHPIISALDRANVIAGLEAVDYVFIFNDKNAVEWLKKIGPDVHVKGRGSEFLSAFEVEKQAVAGSGGRVILAPNVQGRSTTAIIKTILARYNNKL